MGELKKKAQLKLKNSKNPQKNIYLQYLLEFGGGELIFGFLNTDSIVIRIPSKYKMKKIPNLSRFQSLEQLIINDNNLKTIDESVFTLPYLEVLSLPNNKLITVPSSINQAPNLKYINLIGNPIIGDLTINPSSLVYYTK